MAYESSNNTRKYIVWKLNPKVETTPASTVMSLQYTETFEKRNVHPRKRSADDSGQSVMYRSEDCSSSLTTANAQFFLNRVPELQQDKCQQLIPVEWFKKRHKKYKLIKKDININGVFFF